MYNIAAHMLAYVEPVGCAIHLALDVQGWEPPKDFMQRFVTRSKKIMRIDGIEELEFAHNTIATTYGRGETYMFGTAGALQCSIYNKTLEAKHRDKMHFWEGIWKHAVNDDLSSAYDPEKTVWRIELRFHQSVLREYAQGIPCNVDTGEVLDASHGFNRFIDVVPHLSGLWRTAMQSYRLNHSRDLIDPAWQLMQEDARFYCHEPAFMYKRARKTPGLGNEKNVTLAFGNLISIYARQGFRTMKPFVTSNAPACGKTSPNTTAVVGRLRAIQADRRAETDRTTIGRESGVSIKKVKGGWKVDIWPDGRYGKRIRKRFPPREKQSALKHSCSPKLPRGKTTHRRKKTVGAYLS
ncbi:hypothetical protein [Halomonas sp. PA16-9]|uniref:hypothetical protein n=1 Tax=Halomonas sp. PA16-9 TaxID=2576841 RepID=UPI0030EF1A94